MEQRPVYLDDVAQALCLAPPTQRLLAYIYKKSQQWPGKPIYEKFEVIQQEAKLFDLDFANALEELHAHGVVSCGCSEDADVSTAHIIHSLRYRFVHGTLDEPRKLNVALIQLHWPEAIEAVRAAQNGETSSGGRQRDEALHAPTSEAGTSYRITFRDGKPVRLGEEEVPRPEERPAAIPRDEPQPPPVSPNNEGWVYVLRVGRDYKIGKTLNLGPRMAQLRIQLPEKPEVIHTIATNDISWVERHWHKHFASKRRNGEWFLLAPEDVEELKAIRRMDVER